MKTPEIIDVGDESEQRMDQIVLPDSLENCYMIVPPKLRLVMLSCLLLKAFNAGTTKVIVFMSCQDVVDYYSVLLSLVLNKLFKVDIESSDVEDDFEEDKEKKKHQVEERAEEANHLTILQLHGNMSQNDRTAAFKKFHNSVHGILLCTDVVSRGLDLPNVDLVVQMSVPPLVEDYVHRVGRTARVGSKGRSILVLLPSETKFVHHLQGHVSVQMDAVKVEQYMDTLNKVALFEGNKQLHTEQERLAYLQVRSTQLTLSPPSNPSFLCLASLWRGRGRWWAPPLDGRQGVLVSPSSLRLVPAQNVLLSSLQRAAPGTPGQKLCPAPVALWAGRQLSQRSKADEGQ